MADIRTAPAVDDFNRANEDPAALPWLKADSSNWAADMHITSTNLVGHAGDSMYAYTEVQLTPGDCEIWGEADSLADLTEGWRMCLLANPGAGATGYAMRYAAGIGNDTLTINRVSGGSQVNLLTITDTFWGSFIFYWLMRLNGDAVEVWVSLATLDTWFLGGTVDDTTYRTGLYGGLGISTDDGTGPWWRGFGATLDDEIPQIYRRPSE